MFVINVARSIRRFVLIELALELAHHLVGIEAGFAHRLAPRLVKRLGRFAPCRKLRFGDRVDLVAGFGLDLVAAGGFPPAPGTPRWSGAGSPLRYRSAV